jgi:protein involved in polysaccharide export with SLBB domain
MPSRCYTGLAVSLFCIAGLSGAAIGQTSRPSPPASTSTTYSIGPEDVLTITVLRHPEFSGDFLVPQSGSIQIPAVGAVHVEGMTLDALTRLVTGKLADTRLWNPEVTITLRSARLRRVYVLGDVKLSGAYDWKPGWNISQLISSSGGLALDLEQSDVKITLEHISGAPSTTMPLTEALNRSSDPSLQIQPGDTLRVDEIATVPVYVAGQVVKPGLYRIRSDAANVLSAISEAGGATPEASLTVRVEHITGKEDTIDLAPTLVQGKRVALPTLRGGDMVIVSQSLNRFTVLGYVSKPGNYPIPDGHVYHLSDAIAVAEDTSGPEVTADRRGRITRIGIVRVVDNKPTNKVYDLSKFLRKGVQSQNPVIQSGDIIYVPQSNGIELTTSLAAISTGAILYYNFRH